MKYHFYLGLLLGLLLVFSGKAQAQPPCPVTPNLPAACAQKPFLAFIDGTNQEVQAFCVGQPIRFEKCSARDPSINIVSYQVEPGTPTGIPSCSPANMAPYIYTPTMPGTVTVFELSNRGATSEFYTRTFQVFDKPLPAFGVLPCTGNNVLITFQTTSSYDQYYVQLGSGPLQGPYSRSQSITLPTAGASSVTVIGRYTQNQLCENSQTQTIPILTPALPLRLTRLLQAPRPGNAATLTLSNVQADYVYTLLREDPSGAIQTVGPVPTGSTSFSLPAGASGCYYLRRTDACQQDVTLSTKLCAFDLSVTPAAGRNLLAFAYAGAAASYRIERNGTLLTTLTSPATGYEDAAVVCGSTYTYRVTAVLPGGEESISDEETATAISGPAPPAPVLVASFSLSNSVELTPSGVTLPAGSTLRYRKTSAGSVASDFATAATTRVVGDSTAFDELRAAPPCYTVRFVDVCGNASAESLPSCPALLSATATDAEGNTVSLAWSSFFGPAPTAGTTYELLSLNPDGSVIIPQPVGGNAYTDLQPPTDRQVLRYRLRISGGGIPAGSFSYSNVATVVRRLRIQIPTAFTPNGDGLNDVLEVKGRFLRNYVFVVVDRNGQEVFRGTQRSETWDGTINGHAPVNGSYVWRFKQNDEEGKPTQETGTITILK
jgi:gliding motility-associated-like protein